MGLEKKISFYVKHKKQKRLEIKKSLKRFITNFFKELGCYNIEIQSEIIYIFTHKSPDDHKLHRFSMAIKEALDLEVLNSQKTNIKKYLYVLRNCKISYKINSNELKRREGDRVLSCLSSVLLKIHKNYYANVEKSENENKKKVDARNILKEAKKDVFRGFVFVFSGVFPVDINPANTGEWKRAKEFGAECVRTLSVENK